MNKQPFLVGITGGIGSGKSTVCAVFSSLGIPIYDADSNAKRLMSEDVELVAQIKKAFGDDSYLPEGTLNRRYIAKKVFNNDEALQQLNALVHPRVGIDFKHWAEIHTDAPYLIKEAALLLESGSYKSLDKLIVVKASQEERVRRVLLRDLFRSKTEVVAIIEKQQDDASFSGYADYTINNNGDKLILPTIINLHEELVLLTRVCP